MPRTRKPRSTQYRPWSVAIPPAQMIRKVWGLGRTAHNVDITIIGNDSRLMDMDAPPIIPTGSTRREEHRCDDGVVMYCARTDYLMCEGRPS